MKATDSTLQGILNGPNQYVIPVFQRFYSWSKDDWARLWFDLIELQTPEQAGRSHFMGSLVFVPDVHQPNVMPGYLVIDGQQRLITMSLLLCAVRDVAAKRGFDELSTEITHTFLTHPFKKGREFFRVYPRQRDREQYMAVVKQDNPASGQIADALNFFRQQIENLADSNTEAGLRELFNLLQQRLEFVNITLEGENPYRIFKSLNSTGVDLSEADLIRNFMFMRVPLADQDEFDDTLWKPLEQHFENAEGKLNGQLLSSFFRDFLMRKGTYVPPASTFQAFEKQYDVTDFEPKALASELRQYAVFYDYIRGVKPHPDASSQQALHKLRQLDSSTTYPLVLNLMKQVDEGSISHSDFAKAIELLAGFILRRFVVGDTSRAYGRWFVVACRELGSQPLAGLRQYLVSKGFPDDARFIPQLIRFPIYGSRYTRSILETLERSYKHREGADLSQAQIEHIMPQTLTDSWRADLGMDADRVHAEWLHTIGNLTLSAYNGELSNHNFADKQEEYRKSNIVLTKQLGEVDSWDEPAIQVRGQQLAQRIAESWAGPNT